MNNKLKLFLITFVTAVLICILVFSHFQWQGSLVNPWFGKVSKSVPTPLPSSTPKQYKFDASTDLKKELEEINPQVLDGDFE